MNGGELIHFPTSAGVSSEVGKESAIRLLALPVSERASAAKDLYVAQPETLLALCQLLDRDMDASPGKVFEDADWLYEFLRRNPEGHSFLFDEREYYLGELALLTGTAARILGKRDQARNWFARAETWFLLTVNVGGDVARVTYQRLALKLEEREFAEVTALASPLAEVFSRSGSREHALKCRFLEAVALRETDRLSEALTAFEAVAEEARCIESVKVLSPALVSVIQIHCELGDSARAMSLSMEAAPVLRSANNRVSLAKLQWGLANLLRKTGKIEESITTFRAAQSEFQEIGLRADVAALHLVLGDLLLETGQERQAEWEIRAALPIIDELKMVPEGFAAMSLLRESLRRRSIDRQALRNLHGYFEEVSS